MPGCGLCSSLAAFGATGWPFAPIGPPDAFAGTAALEVHRTWRRGDRRLALIGRDELIGPQARGPDLVALKRRRSDARLGRDALVLGRGNGADAGGAADIADIGHIRDVIDERLVVVDIRDARAADIVDGRVVEEAVAIPASAVIAAAEIAEAVIDAAVVADLMRPVAAMEGVDAADEGPIARGPQAAPAEAARPTRPAPSNSRHCCRPSSRASSNSRAQASAAGRNREAAAAVLRRRCAAPTARRRPARPRPEDLPRPEPDRRRSARKPGREWRPERRRQS